MVCEVVQGVLMHGSSMFKRWNKIKGKKTISQLKDANTAVIVRKPQEKKKRGLKRLFQLSPKKTKQIIQPSLTQALNWSLLSEDSDSAFMDGNSSRIGSTIHAQCVLALSTDDSIRTSSSSTIDENVERLQEEIVSLQATLNEFQKNEFEYCTICDEYEIFVLEQDAEIEKKELKIMHLKQMVEMIDSESAEEAKKSDDLQTSLPDCQSALLCPDHERTVKTRGLNKANKRQQRELQQQKRVYATLVLQSQAATQKLQETIAAHESHLGSLKAQLEVLASKREGLQILQAKTLKEELDAISERYRHASVRIEEKSQVNQRRRSMWEEIIILD